MHIGEDYKDCNFWAYEPNKPDAYYKGDRAAVEANRENHRKIKEAGLKASRYGIKSKADAIREAEKIEAATGVEMYVFKHDFL